MSSLHFKLRPSSERGHADHGWLKTYHSFSFADYYDPAWSQFGPLRVINEDWVYRGTGFGKHSHNNQEIFSYIIEGELEHKDSLGNLEIMKRGDIQMTSTGTGISHSEYNRNPSKDVRFLQIWCTPTTRGLKPSYYNRHFTDEEKTGKLVKVVGRIGSSDVLDEREGKGPTPIHSPVTVYASILQAGQSIVHSLAANTTKVYLHNTFKAGYRPPSTPASAESAQLVIADESNHTASLKDGDAFAAQVQKSGSITIRNDSPSAAAEFVLFELEE